MKKPNFLIIGAAKCGTTTLHEELRKHPDIFLAEKKDFQFFDSNYAKGWSHYEHFFKKYNGEKIIGETSSNYLFSKKAAQRIKNDLGAHVKLLAIVRSPAKRSFSEFLHQQRYGKAEKNFEYYLEKENDLYDVIVERSMFSTHFKHYFSIFPQKNIKIVVLERLQQNPKKEINEICDFLGIKNLEVEELTKANQAYSPRLKWFNNLTTKPNRLARYLVPSFSFRQKIRKKIQDLNAHKTVNKPAMTAAQKEKLAALLKGEKQRMEQILNTDLKQWKEL